MTLRATGYKHIKIKAAELVKTLALWIVAAVILLPVIMTLCASFMGETELYEHIGAKYWAEAEDEHFMFYDL